MSPGLNKDARRAGTGAVRAQLADLPLCNSTIPVSSQPPYGSPPRFLSFRCSNAGNCSCQKKKSNFSAKVIQTTDHAGHCLCMEHCQESIFYFSGVGCGGTGDHRVHDATGHSGDAGARCGSQPSECQSSLGVDASTPRAGHAGITSSEPLLTVLPTVFHREAGEP